MGDDDAGVWPRRRRYAHRETPERDNRLSRLKVTTTLEGAPLAGKLAAFCLPADMPAFHPLSDNQSFGAFTKSRLSGKPMFEIKAVSPLTT
jgi:hypothetical protein